MPRFIFVCVLLQFLTAGNWLAAQKPIDANQQQMRSGGLSPEDSLERMVVADDLQLDQLLAEPTVAQPVFLNFDARGRMWVVQYRQYPHPAGLSIVSHDQYWRNVYDKVPSAPPNHTPGKDKITIHEDTDGDGTYDRHKTFVDHLNMVTSIAHGRGGIWVLNPPYLLFYPDRNRDDVPDADPEVHLSGFGLEDSHSIANSLRWGPDGWLYGAQGSTVTANIVRPGRGDKPIYSQGQNIWRYHPEQRKYEVFAEGGGNAFGVEIDSVGRVFSGHNGGDTRGFHYVQGAYLRKGFTKHGPLSNPHAYGFFEGMQHHAVERFTHNFVIYDGGSLPTRYQGKLFGVEPLQGRVVVADIEPNGSSFKTADVSRPLTSGDDWFRPVDIKIGPDGGIYVCDWYDGQVNHYKNHQGQIDPTDGRIYRLRSKASPPSERVDLESASSEELVDTLSHSNRWYRQTALRVLADRRDRSVVRRLESIARQENGQLALEALWTLNLIGGLDSDFAFELIEHPNPYVRVWLVRLLGDQREVAPTWIPLLTSLATSEPHVEVRQQLACSARRFPIEAGLPIVQALLGHDDATDIYQPMLLWWALETFCRHDPDRVVGMASEFGTNESVAITHAILERLMRRFASEGTEKDLLRCATLLRNAASQVEKEALMRGFELAFQGRSAGKLPSELVTEIAIAGDVSLSMRLRQGESSAYQEAVAAIRTNSNANETIELIQLLGELRIPAAEEPLLAIVESNEVVELRQAALGALLGYKSPSIANRVIAAYSDMTKEEQASAQSLLASRADWAAEMIAAVDEQMDALSVSVDVLRSCLLFENAKLNASIEARWGDIRGNTTASMQEEVQRLSALVNRRSGDVYSGQKLFGQSCGKCHKLFINGGDIGPDLTSYKRDDVNTMILNVVNPNAEIREGFENYMVVTLDGRIITGLMIERNQRSVLLRTAEGHTVAIDRDDMEESRVLGRSLMPEGILQTMSDEQVADLFAYLRSTQPLNN